MISRKKSEVVERNCLDEQVIQKFKEKVSSSVIIKKRVNNIHVSFS